MIYRCNPVPFLMSVECRQLIGIPRKRQRRLRRLRRRWRRRRRRRPPPKLPRR